MWIIFMELMNMEIQKSIRFKKQKQFTLLEGSVITIVNIGLHGNITFEGFVKLIDIKL